LYRLEEEIGITMNKITKIAYIIIIVTLLITIAYAALMFKRKANEQLYVNPYEYDISALKEVPKDKIGYREIGPLKPGVEKLDAITVDDSDRKYIIGDKIIFIYSEDNKLLNQMVLPSPGKALAVDNRGFLFVAIDKSILVYDNELKQISSIEEELNDKTIITSIAADSRNIYVADAGNRVVLKYSKDGKFLLKIGEKNVATGIPGFVIPSPYFDLALGTGSELWVVDPGRHSLNNFTFDGEIASSWKNASMSLEGFCGCCNPTHIAILPNGSFITSEKGLLRVKEYSPMGEFKTVVAAPKDFAENIEILDLSVDSEGRVYIIDSAGKRVRIFIRN
jgi:hypothetical protein